VGCPPASAGHAERRRKYHAAVREDVNCALLLRADQIIE
jgi:hypothetical protein